MAIKYPSIRPNSGIKHGAKPKENFTYETSSSKQSTQSTLSLSVLENFSAGLLTQ